MPQAQLTNVAGANGEGYSSGPVVQDVMNTSAAAIPFGSVVKLNTPITTTTTTTFQVLLATTTASILNIGVAISGGGDAGVGSSIPISGTGQIVVHGHTRALFDTTNSGVTSGHGIIIGGTTAGCLGDSNGTTSAAGVSYGVILETLTAATAGTLVNIWFERT